nr:PREDICTED: alpha-(1,3)-fucosyltransferase 6-like [Linepithema humile]XP_012233409.1 PREDICTED: alpha-(1,3)-fucosyltransferase 6-like [Linepithema humile]XP_012233410.1 PREDICTED: alpha-(1,3)-fucosyltransferase 6-like [Linepithema humile]XP_012233411.1 PREDICTED: alpha-(1,3)-fucosyltransferase 6-like [Linepithema humile]XP_012233412.1 PREDICTED: alpha-(1,3)-fucosyltransferase 6-like [Linepithema humile]XP_012233413.1 PREDICTED: alpha-(1,3)-fucosyltransferase 6-like [Linepithema humile]XP_01
MLKFSQFRRLAFVLLITVTITIFCKLLLAPIFFTSDRRSPVFKNGQTSITKEEKEKLGNPEWWKFFFRSKILNEQLMKMTTLDAHLLERGFTNEQVKNISALGKWLLAPEGSPPPDSNATNGSYLILIWKHGSFLERRHIRRFTFNKFSPWDQCSVRDCILSYDEKDLHQADAVVFHLHRTKSPSELPVRSRVDQWWIFLTDESPFHTFLHNRQKLSDYDGLFNWSMSYRMDSDVPVPYGRTVRISSDVSSRDAVVGTSKTKLVAVMGSNCGGRNGRWSYVKALKSSLRDDLDVLGRCLNGNSTVCPGHFDRDCAALNAYKFYLSFENSNCREYLTEKVFWQAYNKFAVPIIMGASREDCRRLLPPHSFLHTDDFAGANALADYLRYLDRDDEHYLKYHEWRVRYRVINEHGYFGSMSKHYCRICEALHYNSAAPKVYTKLEHWWSKDRDCAPATA